MNLTDPGAFDYAVLDYEARTVTYPNHEPPDVLPFTDEANEAAENGMDLAAYRAARAAAIGEARQVVAALRADVLDPSRADLNARPGPALKTLGRAVRTLVRLELRDVRDDGP